MHVLHAGQERETLLCAEEPMTTVECIAALLDHVRFGATLSCTNRSPNIIVDLPLSESGVYEA